MYSKEQIIYSTQIYFLSLIVCGSEMDNLSNESFSDPNIVILPTPPGPNSVRAAKQLARCRSQEMKASSKRLQVIQDLCKHTKDQQNECHEYVQRIFGHLSGSNLISGGDNERSIIFRDYLDSFFKRILDDNDSLQQGQQELLTFMENFQNETIQQCSLCCIRSKQEICTLREQVGCLGSEVSNLKIAINRLNAVITKMSALPKASTSSKGPFINSYFGAK